MALLSKPARTRIVDGIVAFLRRSRMSDKSIGVLLRSYHASAPVLLWLGVLFASQEIAAAIIAYLVALILLFVVLFGGCWLSMVENKVCDDDFTVVDPFLEMAGLEKSSAMRYRMSCAIGAIYFGAVLLMYHRRFGGIGNPAVVDC